MKKVLIVLLTAFVLSGCYLILDNVPTSIPLSSTPDDALLSSTETKEPPETSVTKTTISDFVPTTTNTRQPTEKPTDTPLPQFTATPFPITIQSGTPKYILNFAHPSSGCKWLGVAGQVFDGDGKPMINKVIMVTGKIEENVVEIIGVSGVPEADIYGPGGFEIKIADHAFSSDKAFSIQVFDLDGIPISGLYPFDTYSDCEKNLIIINFLTAE